MFGDVCLVLVNFFSFLIDQGQISEEVERHSSSVMLLMRGKCLELLFIIETASHMCGSDDKRTQEGCE